MLFTGDRRTSCTYTSAHGDTRLDVDERLGDEAMRWMRSRSCSWRGYISSTTVHARWQRIAELQSADTKEAESDVDFYTTERDDSTPGTSHHTAGAGDSLTGTGDDIAGAGYCIAGTAGTRWGSYTARATRGHWQQFLD
ncbi:hypothetical protein Tco_0934953 [Tanacetum coccineum]